MIHTNDNQLHDTPHYCLFPSVIVNLQVVSLVSSLTVFDCPVHSIHLSGTLMHLLPLTYLSR